MPALGILAHGPYGQQSTLWTLLPYFGWTDFMHGSPSFGSSSKSLSLRIGYMCFGLTKILTRAHVPLLHVHLQAQVPTTRLHRNSYARPHSGIDLRDFLWALVVGPCLIRWILVWSVLWAPFRYMVYIWYVLGSSFIREPEAMDSCRSQGRWQER